MLATAFHRDLRFGDSSPYLCLECLDLFPTPKDFFLFLWEIDAHVGDGRARWPNSRENFRTLMECDNWSCFLGGYAVYCKPRLVSSRSEC